MEMVAFMLGGIGQIVSVNINTIVEKTYPEPWNYSSYPTALSLNPSFRPQYTHFDQNSNRQTCQILTALLGFSHKKMDRNEMRFRTPIDILKLLLREPFKITNPLKTNIVRYFKSMLILALPDIVPRYLPFFFPVGYLDISLMFGYFSASRCEGQSSH